MPLIKSERALLIMSRWHEVGLVRVFRPENFFYLCYQEVYAVHYHCVNNLLGDGVGHVVTNLEKQNPEDAYTAY